jgi:hypothetical protein
MSRTTSKVISFEKPFKLKGWATTLPAGDYQVEIEEERLEAVSFVAHRRVAVFLHLPVQQGKPGQRQTVCLPPEEFAALLLKDQQSVRDERGA